jgi:hypothetical protein
MMNGRRLAYLGMAFALSASFGAAQATVINGDFELGNLSGWTAVVPSGGTAAAQTSNPDTGATPFQGNWMASLKTDGPGSFTTLSQTINLTAGAHVKGWAQFFDAELGEGFPDLGEVRILNPLTGALIATVFSDNAADPGTGLRGWTFWSFTALATADYTIQARIANAGDAIVDSWLFVDFVAVPEPGTLALLGLGLLGLGFARARRSA